MNNTAKKLFLRLARAFSGKRKDMADAAESTFGKRDWQLSGAEREYLRKGSAEKVADK